jgi:hypothetical protein
MLAGTPIARQWILVLHNGVIVVDWGGGQGQDVYSGEFLTIGETDVSHTAQDDELEMLKRASLVSDFDGLQAWVIGLPERPARSLD